MQYSLPLMGDSFKGNYPGSSATRSRCLQNSHFDSRQLVDILVIAFASSSPAFTRVRPCSPVFTTRRNNSRTVASFLVKTNNCNHYLMSVVVLSELMQGAFRSRHLVIHLPTAKKNTKVWPSNEGDQICNLVEILINTSVCPLAHVCRNVWLLVRPFWSYNKTAKFKHYKMKENQQFGWGSTACRLLSTINNLAEVLLSNVSFRQSTIWLRLYCLTSLVDNQQFGWGSTV